MPNYKTHLIGGLISFALVIGLAALYMPIFNIPTSLIPMAFTLSLIGSIFPDIDVPSKMQKWFFIASFNGVLIALLTNHYHIFALLGICILFVAFLTHRTITHKPAFLLIFSLIPTLYASYTTPEYTYTAFALYLYFTSGCLSHILFDRILSRFKRLIGKSHRF
jgi:membrane-bound metal-dependent hydrolase YbcI (DUF457 family)